MVVDMRNEASSGVELLATQAFEEAALFTELPVVLRVFELAHSGNINDPESPQSQQARELLRAGLALTLKGIENQVGAKLQLHFHLSNGRSLLRTLRKNSVSRMRSGRTSPTTSPTSARP